MWQTVQRSRPNANEFRSEVTLEDAARGPGQARTVEGLLDEIVSLIAERQEARAANRDSALELNRIAIADRQRELSHALIERYACAA